MWFPGFFKIIKATAVTVKAWPRECTITNYALDKTILKVDNDDVILVLFIPKKFNGQYNCPRKYLEFVWT